MTEKEKAILESLARVLEESCRNPEPDVPWTSKVATGALCFGSLALFWFLTFFLPLIQLTGHRRGGPPLLAGFTPTQQLWFCIVLYLVIMPPLLWWAWRARADLPPERDIDGRLGSPSRLVLRDFFSAVVVFLPDLAIQFFHLTFAPSYRPVFPGLMGAGIFWLVARGEVDGEPKDWTGPLTALIGPLPQKDLVPLAGMLRTHGLLQLRKRFNERNQEIKRWELGLAGRPLAARFGLTGPGIPTGFPG